MDRDWTEYRIDEFWEGRKKIKEENTLGDYKISFLAERDVDNLAVRKIRIEPTEIRPMGLFFQMKKFGVVGKSGVEVDMTKIIPEGWEMELVELASIRNMPPEVQEGIMTVNTAEMPSKHSSGKIVIGPLGSKFAREKMEMFQYEPANVVPILLWNILLARFLKEGEPVSDEAVEGMRDKLKERRQQLLEMLEEKGVEEKDWIKLAKEPFFSKQ